MRIDHDFLLCNTWEEKKIRQFLERGIKKPLSLIRWRALGNSRASELVGELLGGLEAIHIGLSAGPAELLNANPAPCHWPQSTELHAAARGPGLATVLFNSWAMGRRYLRCCLVLYLCPGLEDGGPCVLQ